MVSSTSRRVPSGALSVQQGSGDCLAIPDRCPRRSDLLLLCLTGWSDTGQHSSGGLSYEELGLSLVQEVEADRSSVSVSIQDALDSYLRLKGAGRSKTFFQGAERAVGYLQKQLMLRNCIIVGCGCGALP